MENVFWDCDGERVIIETYLMKANNIKSPEIVFQFQGFFVVDVEELESPTLRTSSESSTS